MNNVNLHFKLTKLLLPQILELLLQCATLSFVLQLSCVLFLHRRKKEKQGAAEQIRKEKQGPTYGGKRR